MRSLAPLLVLLVAGCETEVRFPPDLWGFTIDSGQVDTGLPATDEGEGTVLLPLVVERAQWGCNADDTLLNVVATTNTRSSDAEVTLYTEKATPWQETHRLKLDFDDPGLLTRRATLTHDATQFDWQPDVSTALNCTDDVPTMSFVVRAWTLQGVLGDCVLWNPTDLVISDLQDDPDVLALGGCTLLIPEA